MANKTDAIRKLPIPKMIRKLRGFIGAVNYLSMYLPKLQLIMRPHHELTKKKITFKWGNKQQEALRSMDSSGSM